MGVTREPPSPLTPRRRNCWSGVAAVAAAAAARAEEEETDCSLHSVETTF